MRNCRFHVVSTWNTRGVFVCKVVFAKELHNHRYDTLHDLVPFVQFKKREKHR